MLARFLYAELPRPTFSFAERGPAIFEWSAVKAPTFWFVDQEVTRPKHEWAAVRRPTLLFAALPRPEFAFVPFDIELYYLSANVEPPPGYVFVSRAGRVVTYTGRKVIFEAA